MTQNDPDERHVYSTKPDKPAPKQDVDLDAARKVTPFKIIRRGDDTVDRDDDVVFADFSPKVLPANTPEPEEITLPKDESAPAPAPLQDLAEATGLTNLETPVQTPAD